MNRADFAPIKNLSGETPDRRLNFLGSSRELKSPANSMRRTMAETIVTADHGSRRVINWRRANHDARWRSTYRCLHIHGPSMHHSRLHDHGRGLIHHRGGWLIDDVGLLIDYWCRCIHHGRGLERPCDHRSGDDAREHFAGRGPFTISGVGLLRACDEDSANCKGDYDFFHTLPFCFCRLFVPTSISTPKISFYSDGDALP